MTGGRVVYAYARRGAILGHRQRRVPDNAVVFTRALIFELAAELVIVQFVRLEVKTFALAESVAFLLGQGGVVPRKLDHRAGGKLTAAVDLQHVTHGR